MKFLVAQVSPELCLTEKDFILAIDKKIFNITKDHDQIDLVFFPEALGLWLCMMEPTSWLSRIFSRFLHPHRANAVQMHKWIADDTDRSDEIIANLQFARPEKKINNNITYKSMYGLLDSILSYNEVRFIEPKNIKLANFLTKISNWIFSKLSLKFLAQYLRSNEILSAYKSAFSLAAQKYNVHIQAGSLFERVIGGTKNVAYVFAPDGSIVCRQEKWNPIAFEGMLGVKPGSGYDTFDVKGVKCGIAICNDLGFKNNLVKVLSDAGCALVAGPSGGIVPSHLWKFDYKRDVEDCQIARAKESNVVIGRSYNAGDLLLGVLKFQGLSTIVDSKGLISIVPKERIRDEYNLVYEIEKPPD